MHLHSRAHTVLRDLKDLESTPPTDDHGAAWETYGEVERDLEEVIGIAMVCCQTAFDRVISECLSMNIGTLSTRELCQDELMPLGPKASASYSKPELIHALANCYKHQSEWDMKKMSNYLDGGLNEKKPRGLKNARTISENGIPLTPHDILHNGARVVVGEDLNLSSLGDIFTTWFEAVQSKVATE